MSKPVNISDTLVFNPTGTTGSSNITTNSNYPLSNGYNSISNTSNYARIQLSATTTTTDCYIYYTFNVTGIPSNATITNVACTARIYANSRVTTGTTNTAASIQLYANTTAKGSAQRGFSTSAQNITISSTGSWTLSELSNARLRITGRRSSTSQSSYIYFYGANLTVTYSISGIDYEITATLATDKIDSIDPAGYTEVFQGDTYSLRVYTSHFNDIMAKDNGVDVTNQLVLTQGQAISSSATIDASVYDSSASSYNSGYTDSSNSAQNGVYSGNTPSNGATGASSTTRACVFSNTGANAASYLVYRFDTSDIPSNATITSVSCTVKASYYSSNSMLTGHTAQLYAGTTAKGTGTSITGTGSSSSTQNIDGGSSWTREEIENLNIKYTVTRGTSNTDSAASFSFWGATVTIAYTTPAENYYLYTLTNVSEDHTIIFSDAIIEIPDEDPQYDYYPITISTINATATPGVGTTRVVEGTNQTITIYPSDPIVTLVTDNGVDITNQLVQHGGTINDPTVTTLQGANYGFTYSSSTGYYVSDNKGVSKSAAVCRVSFDLPVRCLVTIQYINYAEATYDFGVFGNIDTALNTNYYAAGSNGATITDTSYKLACNTSTYNTSSVQSITYEINSGQHFIDIKYSKDDATDNNNDTLQWKIASIEPLESNNYYTYTLSNIQEEHSLIFIFGNVTYYFVNSSGTNCKLYPNGSSVVLDGNGYFLTIVPDDYSYQVSVFDNNVDVTSNVVRKEQEVTKDGNTYTVVNYTYDLTNIHTTHNLTITCNSTSTLFIKLNGSWISATKVYKKVSNAWVEQDDIQTLLNDLDKPLFYQETN